MKTLWSGFLVLPVSLILLGGCAREEAPAVGGSHSPAAADFERGPHRGRLLRDGEFLARAADLRGRRAA